MVRQSRRTLATLCAWMLLHLCFVRVVHATESIAEPEVGLAIGGATLVALAAGYQTVKLIEGRTGSHACNTWGCTGSAAAAAVVEPLGASLLLAWAWQLGQQHEAIARTNGNTRDYRVLRGAAAIVGLSSSALKTILFGYNLWLRQQCSGNDVTDCQSRRIQSNDLISFALTPTLIAGALAAGYGIGYESGKPKGLTLVTLAPMVAPGNVTLRLQVQF